MGRILDQEIERLKKDVRFMRTMRRAWSSRRRRICGPLPESTAILAR